MGNVGGVPLSASSESAVSSRSSETSLADVDDLAVRKPTAPTTLHSRSRRSNGDAGCLSACWSTTPPSPPLLLVNAIDVCDGDEEDEAVRGGPSYGSPRDDCSCRSHLPSSAESRASSVRRRRSSSSLSLWEDSLDYTDQELALPDHVPTHASNLDDKDLYLVTTAALPWLTGTAINPLLRAAHLALVQARDYPSRQVTLVVPWLEDAQDRLALYGMDWENATPARQEEYIRDWLRLDAGLCVPEEWLQIRFYPARYHASLQSIFAMGDLCERLVVRDPDRSVCVLEEPEHVNFYRAPGLVSWRSKFPHVVGVVHTNYKAYAANHIGGVVTAPLVGAMSSFMVRAYCDQVIKLSSVLQEYASEKETVCNVHGIRSAFLQASPPSGHKIYFIGKMLWAKGLDKLLELQAYHRKITGHYFPMSVYGSGPELEEIEQAFLGQRRNRHVDHKSSYEALSKYYSYSFWSGFRQPLPVTFMGRQDHASLSSDYKIFVNPSITEVLCTTTAEAVAMNKWVIVPRHASNEFFAAFPNVLQYSHHDEFVQFLQYALAHSPDPLSDELRHTLSWEAATERFLRAASVSERDAARRARVGSKYDETIAKWHYKLGKGSTGDVLRKVMGGGPVADQHKYERQSSNSSLNQLTDTPSTMCVR